MVSIEIEMLIQHKN